MSNEKELTLKDLENGATPMVEVDPYQLKPKREVEEKNILIDDAFNSLMNVTDRIEKESEKFHQELAEYEMQEEEEKLLTEDDDSEDDELEEETPVVKTEEPKANIKVPTTLEIDEDDFKDDEDDEDDIKDERDVQFDEMKSKIKETIKPINKKIDLASFKISKRPVSVANALKTSSSKKTIVDWALFSSEKAISMTEFTGFEIEKLNPRNSTRNNLNTYTDIYKLIFEHIVDPNKPMTMEEWIKGIKFYDQNHLYMAIYRASFHGSNYIPYDCPHCKNVFVTSDISMEDMVKYKNDEAREKAKKILEKETTTETHEYDVDLVQISDDYVIGFKDPSIYNVVFESIVLDDKFLEKYAELLQIISYIDSIYLIDYETSELRPIEVQEFPNNFKKTVKSKINRYAKVIQSLNSDQFNQLESILKERDERHDGVSYVLPQVKCTKCGKDIEERPMTSEDLLFTRHQLARIANI